WPKPVVKCLLRPHAVAVHAAQYSSHSPYTPRTMPQRQHYLPGLLLPLILPHGYFALLSRFVPVNLPRERPLIRLCSHFRLFTVPGILTIGFTKFSTGDIG